ncbi:SAM-dependent methyltransferase [Amycolatopsis sp. lyj-112]|uniref:SAM-dependent methyltransferase n=1 Tax=Amycolatopsis sp. lyj-112 TaxID=2789288 RepID=UPI00397D3C92
MNRPVETWRDERGPFWGGPCPALFGCCLSFHTSAKRVDYQRYWTALPTPCSKRPHPALVDNVLRNGDQATPNDRRLADELTHISLAAPAAVRERDQFTARVVDHAVAEGITQFLDLGSGLACTNAAYAALTDTPSSAGTAPSIVFVDNDKRVHDFNRAWLRRSPHRDLRATAVRGNCFAIPWMLRRLRRAKLLDLDRPVCVLMVDILHFFEGRAPRTIIRSLTKHLPPGSIVAVTHLTDRPLLLGITPSTRKALRDDTARWCRAYQRCVPPHPRTCTPAQFATRLADLDLLAPGVSSQSCWPSPDTTQYPRPPFTLAAVCRVPHVTTSRADTEPDDPPTAVTPHSTPRGTANTPLLTARDVLVDVFARSGATREDFAASVGYPCATISRVLNGSSRITPELAHAAAQHYELDPLDLLIRQNRTALATITADRDHITSAAGSPSAVNRHPVGHAFDDSASAIEVLRAVVADTGLSQSRFAVTVGYDPRNISKILNGKHSITAGLADSVGRRYGIDADDLLARQSRSQLAAIAERLLNCRAADSPPE